MKKSILIVEDEQVLRESLAGLLEEEGFEVLQAGNGAEAYAIVLERPVSLILTDVRMPEMEGMELLDRLRQLVPETPVIMMTAYGTVDSAVAAMKAGGWDYLLKPVQFDDLLLKVQRALEFGELSRDRKVMSEQLAAQSTFHDLVSESPNMLQLFEQVRKLSTVKSSVLLVGESGTGKELFARAIHYNGVTRGKPFVAVNSAAIPDTLIASELFGHRKGAFTGAIRDKMGLFEAATGGTIFLDEISTLPTAVQSTLLRVIEERLVVPVGDTKPRPVDVRIIAASNQDVEGMVREGTFREDLYFRLNVVTLELPPLRHRKGDIPLLVHHFLDKYTTEMNKDVQGVTNGAMRALLSHEWPGNVSELENVIERACIFADGRQVGTEDLPFAAGLAEEDVGEDLKAAMSHFERQHILYSLRRHNYDKAETARVLGIGISSLYRKLDDLEIPKNLGETDSETPVEPSQK
ncbi:MAG: sigma-54-dependent transcriptional regulator [Planctomycetota bacterium]|jgi:two-component system response regulator PilR (NtrC family)